jgi:hypothetical protein
MLAGSSHAGNITRGGKAGGGTDFNTGQTITASEFNTDFNNLYTLVNGQLDTDNIDTDGVGALEIAADAVGASELADDSVASANIIDDSIVDADVNSAAAIDGSKINDYSTDDAEQATISSPGTSDALTNATDLETEIEQLRYKIEEMTVGTSASAVAASGATAAFASWADGPIRSGNLVYNGSFNSFNVLSTSTDSEGWVKVLTPTVQNPSLTEADGQGAGYALRILDTVDALAGAKQTLDGLKANSRYLVKVSVLDTTGTCRLTTTGADTNDLSITSDDSGTWQVLSGTFETDSTPTDVDISLLNVAANYSCTWAHLGVFEINTDPAPRGSHTVFQETSTATAAISSGGTLTPIRNSADSAALDVNVMPSIPGTIIVVTGTLTVTAGDGLDRSTSFQIDENGSNVGPIGGMFTTAIGEVETSSVRYVNYAPVPGTLYTYKLDAETSGATTQGGSLNGNTLTSDITVLMLAPQ